jgi:hypothetical protein
MKPKPAVAAIAVGLVLVVVGFDESNQPCSQEVWLVAVGMVVAGFVVISVGLIGMAWGLSE